MIFYGDCTFNTPAKSSAIYLDIKSSLIYIHNCLNCNCDIVNSYLRNLSEVSSLKVILLSVVLNDCVSAYAEMCIKLFTESFFLSLYAQSFNKI